MLRRYQPILLMQKQHPVKEEKKPRAKKVEKTNNNQTVTEELTTHQMNK